MQENRRYIRWAVSLPVKYKVEAQEQEFSSFTRDMSNGGLCIHSPERLKADSILDIIIYMPQDIGPLYAKGRVIWQREPHNTEDKNFLSGIKFINLAYSDRDKIFNYLYRHQHKELVRHWWDCA